MQVSPHIYRYAPEDRSLLSTHGVHAYFIVSQGEAIMVDPFDGREEVVAAQLGQLRGLGNPRLLRQVVTHRHFDHYEGALKIKAATGARLGVHPGDAPAVADFLKTPPDDLLNDGDILPVGGLHLEVIHTPGHTPGHCCFYLQEARALFTGDHIMGLGTVVVGPPEGDMVDYLASLRRLLEYDLDLIVSGHGPLVTEPKKKIQELIQHRLEREEQVLGLVRQGKGTVAQLLAEVYPEITDRLQTLARRTLLGHLAKLEKEGKVASRGQGEEATFYPA